MLLLRDVRNWAFGFLLGSIALDILSLFGAILSPQSTPPSCALFSHRLADQVWQDPGVRPVRARLLGLIFVRICVALLAQGI